MIRLAIALLAAFATQASAIEPPATLGLHLASIHAQDGKDAPGSRGWNNATTGLYARWANGFTAGVYRNSLYRTSAYAGWTFADSADRYAITLGIASGYDRLVADGKGDHQAVRCNHVCRTVSLRSVYVPLVVPSVRIPLTQRVSVRLSAVLAPRQPPAAHLSLEWRL